MGFDKLSVDLNNLPVIAQSIRAFESSEKVAEIIVVTSADRIEFIESHRTAKVSAIIEGGSERHFSVWNGIQACAPEPALIAVHDGARPLVSAATIDQCAEVASAKGAATLAHRVTWNSRGRYLLPNDIRNHSNHRSRQSRFPYVGGAVSNSGGSWCRPAGRYCFRKIPSVGDSRLSGCRHDCRTQLPWNRQLRIRSPIDGRTGSGITTVCDRARVLRLFRLGPIAIGGGCLQVVLTLGLAALVAKLAGLDWKPAIAVGAAVALSSTACVLRLLIDRAEIDSVHGRTILGILLLQDVAVVPLVLLVTMLGGSGTIGQMGVEMSKAIGLIILLIAGFLSLSKWVLPHALKHLSMSRDRELLVLLAVFLAIGSAWAAHAFNLSPALGAFIAGMMLAESPFATQIRSDIGALRILFVTLFFTSVGMLGNPVWIYENMVAVGIVTLALILGKCLIITVITRLFRLPLAYAFASGAALAQVGEFGIVIAGIANSSELFDNYLFHLIVSSTLVSLLITPFLVNSALSGGKRLQNLFHKENVEIAAEATDVSDGKERVILIGFGPAGPKRRL
ncbi:K(+) efflux antiporter 5 [Nymphon striatum]|nr:K(+) efflux antiporter 5 [Nymphon striatum]